MKFLKQILLTLIITLTSLNVSAVNCDAYSAWSSGSQTIGYKTYGGELWYNSCNGCWDGAGEPPSYGKANWTLIGTCSSVPVVTTQNASSVTSSTMTFNGTVTNNGGFVLTDRGFIYGTDADDVSNSEIGALVGSTLTVSEGGTTVSSYSEAMTGLCPGITYYYKAYATNSSGSGYDVSNITTSTTTPGTFTTVQAGAFSSSSTWGGCGAPDLTVGHTINIGHDVTSTGLTITEGTDIIVTNGGTLTNTGNIIFGGTGAIVTLTIDDGGTVNTTNINYTSDGTLNSNGTLNVTGTITVDAFGEANLSGVSNIGSIDNNAGGLNITGGTTNITGNYDCANDCVFNGDATITIGGDFKVWGSGQSHVDGDLTVNGTLIMDNNGYLDGTGIVRFVSKNINPNNSGAYVGCVDGTKWDDNVGTPTWDEITSPWDLTDCAVVLPIELISFNATVQDKAIIYTWSTATEINNDYFEILVSNDINNWTSISIVEGSGNSYSILNYVSYSNILGYKYAKLRQTDYNGDYADSHIIALDNSNSNENILEVIGDKAIVKTMDNYELTLYIYDVSGQVVYSKLITDSQVIDLSNLNLNNGMKIIRYGNKHKRIFVFQ